MRPDRLWIFPVVAVCLILLAFASAGDAFGASPQGGVVTACSGGTFSCGFESGDTDAWSEVSL